MTIKIPTNTAPTGTNQCPHTRTVLDGFHAMANPITGWAWITCQVILFIIVLYYIVLLYSQSRGLKKVKLFVK